LHRNADNSQRPVKPCVETVEKVFSNIFLPNYPYKMLTINNYNAYK